MTVTPQGQIHLCKTNLKNDYKNEITFSSKQEQESYFTSTIAHSFGNYTYIKRDNVVQIGENIDKLIDCNYLFYRNDGFTSKIYYCFITNMEYVNENCTKVTFETDVWQTWQFDIKYNTCFTEREHVGNDTIGLHTVPENLESGEYVDQIVPTTEQTSLNYMLHNGNKELYVVLAVSETGLNVTVPSGVRTYNGNYSGLYYLTFPSFDHADMYIKYIQGKITQDVIYLAFLVPYEIATDGSNFKWLQYQDGGTSFNYAFIDYTNSFANMGLISIAKPNYLDGSYIPRNNKLLTYPYHFFTISNNSGSNTNYKYEYFKQNNCTFELMGAIGVGCSIQLVPYDYKEGNSDFNYTYNNYIEALDAGKLPTCGWTNDAYTNWLTQNAVNIPIDLASDFIKVAGGAVTGNVSGVASGLSGITNSAMEIYQHSLIPTTAKGGVNQGDLNLASARAFSIYKKSIKEEYARIIDNYFDMFGYKVNRVKIPNITGRRNWNYVKTIDCNFTGNIPQSDLNTIKTMFDSGVTLWHNPNTMFDYTQPNNIV